MATIEVTVNRYNCTAYRNGNVIDAKIDIDVETAPDLIIKIIADSGYYITDLILMSGQYRVEVGSYINSQDLKQIIFTLPREEFLNEQLITGGLIIVANANITAIEECILNPNGARLTDDTKILLPLSNPKKDRIIYFPETDPTDVNNVVNSESPDLVEYDETLYYKKKTDGGVYSYKAVGEDIEINIVQDLSTTDNGLVGQTQWNNLKTAHYCSPANVNLRNLDTSYEFVKIRLRIDMETYYLKLTKNDVNLYSGLFFIEEGAHIYEISVYYNHTNSGRMILRCATVM